MKSNAPTSAELAPCPCCNSADVVFSHVEGDDPESNLHDFVMCNGCGLMAARVDTECDPCTAWNRRAAMQTAEPVAILRAALIAATECDDATKRQGIAAYALRASAALDRAPSIAPVKDHVIREVVNSLRDIAIQFHATQQLRERIAYAIEPLLVQLRAPSIAPERTSANIARVAGSAPSIDSAPFDEEKLLHLFCQWECHPRGDKGKAAWDAIIAHIKGYAGASIDSAADAKDAARWRWARAADWSDIESLYWCHSVQYAGTPEACCAALDVEADNAIAALQPEGT